MMINWRLYMSNEQVVYYISINEEYWGQVSLLEPYILVKEIDIFNQTQDYHHYPLEKYDELVEKGVLQRNEPKETTPVNFPMPTMPCIETHKPKRISEDRLG